MLENLQDPQPVDHKVFFRIVDRILVGKMGCEMEHIFGFFLKDAF